MAGAAAALPTGSGLFLAARLLLDGAGALFGLYLVTFVALSLAGYVLRMHAGRASEQPAGQP
ncbi:MAG TPA: hypothetical protein VMH35_13720 [Streptosporangiaceae bacterium]|nr:hypothetical protein [Streptosporangiaceae bacterium]